MGVLVWWILPAVTTMLAICWAAWVRRTPRPLSDLETVDQYARFRAALGGEAFPPREPASERASEPASEPAREACAGGRETPPGNGHAASTV